MNHTGKGPRKRRDAERSRCTILLDGDIDRKLSVAAHLRGLDRSELVNEVLANALRYIVISVRGQNGVSAESAGDVNPVASIEAA
jgi:hypothetical protein